MRTFIDTNVWVYAADRGEPEKRARAQSLLAELAPSDVVISAQVMSEYHVTVTRKLASPMPLDEAARTVHAMSKFEVVALTATLVERAIDRQERNVLSFWDSLIVEAAHVARCELLLTEDLQSDQNLNGLQLQNPFA